MKNKILSLHTASHEPFIDFLKGVAIIFVILTHCLPLQNYMLFSLWGAQAVPIFIIIQVFHHFNPNKKPRTLRLQIKKVCNRIIVPFLVLTFVEALLLCLIERTPQSVFRQMMYEGGIGPGCYYPWIYIQLCIITPIIAVVLNRGGA